MKRSFALLVFLLLLGITIVPLAQSEDIVLYPRSGNSPVQIANLYQIEFEDGDTLDCVILSRTEAPSHSAMGCFPDGNVVTITGNTVVDGRFTNIELDVRRDREGFSLSASFDYSCRFRLPSNPQDLGAPSGICTQTQF